MKSNANEHSSTDVAGKSGPRNRSGEGAGPDLAAEGGADEVQRILALKRHEQPPAEFFKGFSESIIDRIHAAGPPPKLTLRQRLSVEFYGVPIYVCVVGVLVCGLLVGGLIAALRVPPPKPGNSNHALVPPAAPTRIGGDTTVAPAGEPTEEIPPAPPATRATLLPPSPGSGGAK